MHRLRNRNFEVPFNYRIPGRDSNDRNRIIEEVKENRSVFQKDDNEKWLLKIAKTKWKWEKTLKDL